MPPIEIEVTCPVFNSFRVQQVGGMFDVPLAQRASERFRIETPEWLLKPSDAEPWSVGLIVGPSGSGKSTIARAIFGDRVYRPREWPSDQAVVDGVGGSSIKEITRLFTAVGFSSPPSWIKPYQVLSGGEQFRCDLARALAGEESGQRPAASGQWPVVSGQHSASDVETIVQPFQLPIPESPNPQIPESSTPEIPKSPNPQIPKSPNPEISAPLVVFDEFTSVVDRNVARVVSAAVAKGIRTGQIGRRLVAVTCHYDVTEWLEPDWVIDMATATFSRRRLRRPPIELEIFRCRRGAWSMFARHHYLSGRLSSYARCFLALWNGAPVAFCAMVSLIGARIAGASAASSRCPTIRASASAWRWPRPWRSCTFGRAAG